MNLAQFQIILQKINSLDKNINMDGKISSIENDLMKAYVKQLYEACMDSDSATIEPVKAQPVVVSPPPAPEAVTEVVTKVASKVTAEPVTPVNVPVVAVAEASPVVEPVAVTPPPAPIVATPPISPTQVVEQVQAIEPTPIVEEMPAVTEAQTAQSKLQELNDRIAANTKTVADKLATSKGKSINDRLADTHKGKNFNDKFTKPEKSGFAAPILIKIPDSLKHMDNSTTNAVQSTPAATPTPPAPQPVQQTAPPAPVKIATPTVAVNATAAAPNLNKSFSLFDAESLEEETGKWGSTPITDLNKSIGLNAKISMIKELFNDDHHAFNNSLTQLNGLGSFDEAKDYMLRNLVTVFNWNQASKTDRAKQLINLVRRRYL